jgi:hypothetical protein
MHPIHILDSWNTIDGMEFQGVLLEYPTPLIGLSNVRHLFKYLDLDVKSVFFFFSWSNDNFHVSFFLDLIYS